MKSWKFTIAVITLVLSTNVNAALISNGNVTTDTASGLDWLDLSVTAGQSYSSAETLNPGWRYAANTEIENLFGILFDGYSDTHPAGYSYSGADAYTDQNSDVSTFQLLFGITHTYLSWEYAYGFYEDETSALRLLGTRQDTQSLETYVFGPEHTIDQESFRITGNSSIGIFLVQPSAVPIPAAIWLFGSGLIGLIGFSRYKKA